jgi:hypothetical protein
VVEDSKILRERNVCKITDGRIQVGGDRKKPLIADYILVYLTGTGNNQMLKGPKTAMGM